MRRAQLYLHTLRYLHPRQVPARARLRLGRLVRERAPALSRSWRQRAAARIPWPAHAPALPQPSPLSTRDDQAIQDLVDAWGRGTPVHLNTPMPLGRPPDWTAPDASQLWRYHLHYFDEAPLLAQGDEAARECLRSLVGSWLDGVPCGSRAHRDAWHPYVVSLRLVNWLLAWMYAPGLFDDDTRFADSVREQVVFLAANLETDVGGNHLLKNLKALACAGACWPDWAAGAAATRDFAEALAAQVLADGVHYERSPMYHAQVLGDALEVLLVLRANGRPAPDVLRRDVARMVDALVRLTHPDDEIALLSDSALGMSFPPAALRAVWGDLLDARTADDAALRHRPLFRHRAPACPSPAVVQAAVPDGALRVHAARHAETHSGIVVLGTPRVRVIADVGALCPDELPAHAQADTFTFELSVDGVRLVVDSGVDEYAPGKWRAYYRSTRAHNTVVVDEADSSECWGSFRAARRARVHDARVSARAGWRELSARHDGFRRLGGGVDHARTFALHDSGLLVVRDVVTGHGAHRVDRFLHLHPGVEILPGAGPSDRVLRRGDVAVRLTWSGEGDPAIVIGTVDPPQGWYGERFGARRPAAVLAWTHAGPLPTRAALALLPLDACPLDRPFAVTPEGHVTPEPDADWSASPAVADSH